MKLAYWMYAGPAHIGVLRVSSSFKNVHAIMHAPLGDDYFNVMRSMLERERDFTPVTASIVDRHVLARGSQEKVVENITRKNKEETPDLILLTPTCTSSILQEDLQNFVELKLAVSNNSNTVLSEPVISVSQKEPSTAAAQQQLDIPEIDVFKSAIFDSVPKQEFVFSSLPVKNEKNLQPDVILADVNHYRVNELQAADRTLEQIVRYYIEKAKKQNNIKLTKTEKPSVNIIGIFTLGFHNQHDCRELKRLFNDLGIKINEIIPEGGDVNNLKNLPQAWFNFVPYREIGLMTAMYLKTEFNMPYVAITPMGLIDTALCIRTMCKTIMEIYAGLAQDDNGLTSSQSEDVKDSFLWLRHKKEENPTTNRSQGTAKKETTVLQNDLKSFENVTTIKKNFLLIENLFNQYIDKQTRFLSQAAWFSRSIDCQNLTGKKVVVFGDATHSAAMTKILTREMGIHVSCAGTYCKHDADWFREQVSGFCDQILITDDHTQVGDTIAKLEPAAIFGTQMERHVGKRLDIPCGVISAPVHIQNFPLSFRPFLGYEGTNQIADLVYNSFNLGMEDHLLQIFGGHDTINNDDPQQLATGLVDQALTTELVQHVAETSTVTMPETNILQQILNRINFQNAKNGEKETSNNKKALRTSQVFKENGREAGSANVLVNMWSPDSLIELNKVPGFVRGKVKRNTEKYALQNNISLITVEVMYAAKEASEQAPI
uniref:Light-independent protochlorophyllide reductase subunit B n=1 Tax=Pandorina morum TaxID=33099 RepID=A0A6C0RVJ5_PANMO|nr:photochlorophyllide reductase subunit B [Pandorina morum]